MAGDKSQAQEVYVYVLDKLSESNSWHKSFRTRGEIMNWLVTQNLQETELLYKQDDSGEIHVLQSVSLMGHTDMTN